MNEKEFLLKFNEESFSEDYDKYFFQKIFNSLKYFLDADSIDYKSVDSSVATADSKHIFSQDIDNWNFLICNNTINVKISNVKKI